MASEHGTHKTVKATYKTVKDTYKTVKARSGTSGALVPGELLEETRGVCYPLVPLPSEEGTTYKV